MATNNIPDFPTMILRLAKGSELTHSELDSNFSATAAFGNMIKGLFGVAINPDGTLNTDAVDTVNIKDRSVTEAKLGPVSVFPAMLDTGATNALKISLTPALTAYSDGQVFIVKVINGNTGAATLNVNNIGAIPIKKRGIVDLEAGDYQGGSVIILAYQSGAFHFVAGSGASSSGSSSSGGFSGFQLYEPADIAVLAAAASASFTHGFATVPTDYSVSMVNVIADLGFVPGDIVDIDKFTDLSGMPAFSVVANSSSITVTRYGATIEHASGTITPASWTLRVRASVKTSTSTAIFPAVTFSVKQPLGVFANGNDIFVAAYGANNSGITYIHRIALNSSNVELLVRDTGATNPQNINAAQFKRADASNVFIFSSTTGIYSLPMLEPTTNWRPVLLTTAAIPNQKPAHIVESGGSITEIYGVTSAYLVNAVSAIQCMRVVVGTGSITAYGVDLDLTSALILSADGTPGNVEFRAWHQAGSGASIMLFQYNKLKKRIYVVTNEDFHLHIFQMNSSTDFKTWWDLSASARAADLQYVKTIAISGSGDAWADTNKEKIFVDVDLETGSERAILFSRSGNTSLSGSVTRIPWRE